MPKKRRSNRRSPFSFSKIKNMSLASLIAMLIYALFEMVQQTTAPKLEPTVLPSSSQPVQFYANQTHDDLTQLYVSAIADAKQSVTIVIYALLDHHVIRALNSKIKQGISVYIVCDAKASPGITKKLPGAHIVRRMGKGLTHQKILVIDDRLVIAGSANLTHDSLRVHGNLVLGIDNPSLAQALSTKIKTMDEEGNAAPLLHQETRTGPQYLEFWVLPDDPGGVKRVNQLLRSAKKTIKVAMFTWTRKDFTEEIIQAFKRGVKVDIVIDRYAGKGAGAKVVNLLSQSGAPVALSTGQGLLHHKFAYIDDEILINGSTNWTNNAFKNNDDYFIVLYPLTEEQKAKMNSIWQEIKRESEPVRP